MRFGQIAATALFVCAACSDTEDASRAAFPANYAATYQEVRDCRKSADHELEFVRVLADAKALVPYTDQTTPFPNGAVLLKEQYDFDDSTCSGAILQWTVMVKDPASRQGGWNWQRVAHDRSVVEIDQGRCASCHSACDGYDYGCAEP